MMHKLFYPDSVAIVGLSSRQNNIPRLTLENMLRWGYRGRIFGVNPKSEDEQVDGIRMYKSIEALPEVPDLVYALVPAKFVPGIVEECGQKGVKWMAIPSGGFSEYSEEGEKLAIQTVATAKKYGIHFVGPNGLTVANVENGLCLPFVPLLRPEFGGMSIISQSGGVAIMMWNIIMDENIGIAKFASIGNKLDLDEVDFLEYLGNDPATSIICMYLESVPRGADLIKVAEKINKPIVVYKSNTTQAGKKAAMSHTAAMSNDEEILNAAFEKAGIIRIYNYHDFFAVAKAFKLPPMRGKRIMVMSPAGGFAVMTADLCEQAGFEFADPGEEFYQSLQKFSNAGVIHFSNPLDLGDIYDPAFTAHVVYSVMHNQNVDGAVYVSQRPQMPDRESVFSRMFLADLSKETWGAIVSSAKPLGICLLGLSRVMAQIKRTVNFPIFNSPEEMVRALAYQMKFNTRQLRQKQDEPCTVSFDGAMQWIKRNTGEIGEDAMELLTTIDVPVPPSGIATTEKEAVAIATRIGYPVVCKLVSKEILHKSDVGGVIVNVTSDDAVKQAFATIHANVLSHKHDATIEGVRISKMAANGVDMFVGSKYDDSFGQVVLYGFGGIYVEVFKDVACSLCPAPKDEIKEKISKLKSYALLKGARGQEPKDIDAYVDIIWKLSHLLARAPQIKEMDLNPVRVFDNGCQVLDIRIKIVQ
ncbi:MAG TPA: acetate--CoA ligase family protein [Spirochaetota bacterium]|nr:acetate--CoA ligase family protein [Spirochaetota bacterium]HOM09299.1 acetate--CoA ligase family protein [Spirochaetota bacterium]HPP49312.1 acetate--CoA ligase family protein [Spirochaetota bacterium]